MCNAFLPKGERVCLVSQTYLRKTSQEKGSLEHLWGQIQIQGILQSSEFSVARESLVKGRKVGILAPGGN